MRRALGLWLPVFGFMAAVWFLSDEVSTHTPEIISDKLLHVFGYACFGLANLRAFHGGYKRPLGLPTAAALLITVAFGALDEWRQAGLVYRDASLGDWVADALGAALAWGLFRMFAQRVGQWKPREESVSR